MSGGATLGQQKVIRVEIEKNDNPHGLFAVSQHTPKLLTIPNPSVEEKVNVTLTRKYGHSGQVKVS